MNKLVIITYFSFLLLILGCASTKEVTSSERVRTEYIHQRDTLLTHDSIHVHDSVFLTQRGDTFFQYKYRTEYRDRFIYKNHNDTILKTDTVIRNVVQVKEVEKKMSFTQKVTSVVGVLALCLLVAILLVFGLRKVII